MRSTIYIGPTLGGGGTLQSQNTHIDLTSTCMTASRKTLWEKFSVVSLKYPGGTHICSRGGMLCKICPGGGYFYVVPNLQSPTWGVQKSKVLLNGLKFIFLILFCDFHASLTVKFIISIFSLFTWEELFFLQNVMKHTLLLSELKVEHFLLAILVLKVLKMLTLATKMPHLYSLYVCQIVF